MARAALPVRSAAGWECLAPGKRRDASPLCWTARKGTSMPTAFSDHRSHRRVEFFLVPVAREQVPVWVFKPAGATEASAGLVMNLGEGGLQVLTASDDAPSRDAYEIELLLGEDDTVPRFRGRVTRVWTREAPVAGWLSGLRFDDEHSSAEDFIRVYQSSAPARRWVRCLLVPPSKGARASAPRDEDDAAPG